MSLESLGFMGDFLAGIAGICTLVTILFVLKQTREMATQNQLVAKSMIISLYKDISGIMLEINKLFFENPDLRQYFYDNVEIKEEEPDYLRAKSLAEMFVDFMDMFVVLARAAPKYTDTPLPWSDWEVFFEEVYASSPIIRKYWAEHSNWYSQTLIDILKELPNEYKQVKPLSRTPWVP